MNLLAELKRRNVIRVAIAYLAAAWLLIQVAETLFPIYGLSDGAIRLVVAILAVGFVPALIVAWLFELTPEGIKRDSEVAADSASRSRAHRILDRAIIVALGLAVSYFAFDKLVLDPLEDARIAQQARSEALADSYGDNSIAVLPFVNRSSDIEQQYFSDGLAEELLNLLTAVPELRVTSRSSSFSFRDDSVDIVEAARKLNVAHILEGSVRRSGGRIRVTAQLIDARTNSTLWSEVYEREIDDVFAIQDDIATSVVSGLKLTILGSVPKSDPVDPEAYSLFLQARHLEYRNSPEAWDRAIELYQQALTIEPEYAEALAGLAASIRDQSSRTAGSMTMAEGLERASQLAQRALEIDPNLAIAYSVLGNIARVSRDFREAAEHYVKALSLAPADPGILLEAAGLITNLGRAEEGVRIQEFLVERDPLNPRAYWLLGYAYETVGRWRDARGAFETALVLSPEMGVVRMAIGLTYLEQDEPEPVKALEFIEQDNNKVWKLVGLTLAHHALGNAAESDGALQSLIDDYGDEAAYNIGAAYAYRDDVDKAFEWLERAVAHNDTGISEIPRQGFFLHSLYGDSRWLPFLEAIGLSPAQLAAVEFDWTIPAEWGRPE